MTADARPGSPPAFISPVARPVPLRQSVYEALVELVVGGRLGPGEHLVETELARQLGVSRQPVREALHRLEAEGWVDLRPNQGAFVSTSPPTTRSTSCSTCGSCSRCRWPGWPRGQLLPAGSPAAGHLARGAERGRLGGDRAGRRGQQRVPRRPGPGGRQHRAGRPGPHREPSGPAGCYRQVAPLHGQESWAEHRELIDAVEAGDQERAAEIARQHTEGTRSAYHQPPKASLR